MDLSKGRSFEAGTYDDWLWNAGGRNPGPVGNPGDHGGGIPIEPPGWGRPPKLPPPDTKPPANEKPPRDNPFRPPGGPPGGTKYQPY
jgi:hypothetical protein